MRNPAILICCVMFIPIGTLCAQNPAWSPQPSPWSPSPASEPPSRVDYSQPGHSPWNSTSQVPSEISSGWTPAPAPRTPVQFSNSAPSKPLPYGQVPQQLPYQGQQIQAQQFQAQEFQAQQPQPLPVLWPEPHSIPGSVPPGAPGHVQLPPHQPSQASYEPEPQIQYIPEYQPGLSFDQILPAEPALTPTLGLIEPPELNSEVLPTTYLPYTPFEGFESEQGSSSLLPTSHEEEYAWHVMPQGLVYKSYLAGPRESRFMTSYFYSPRDDAVWDSTLGGKMGILRKGNTDPLNPRGFQWDMEGAVFTRLDPDRKQDLDAADFRFGIPLTWRNDQWQAKLGYYHISSHIGDEYLEDNPGFIRDNYVRDAFNFGLGYFPNPDLRFYGEAGWAWHNSGAAEKWELQFGLDYSPLNPVPKGTPFAAVNIYMREEVDFDPGLTLQTGWQWLGANSGSLLRVGLHIYTGKVYQFSFVRTPNQYDKLAGLAIWYDF